MGRLFVDTSGWTSLFIPTETYHAEAVEHFRQAQQQQQRLCTTNYIVAELVAAFREPQPNSSPQAVSVY